MAGREDTVVVITGATRGVGRGVARAFGAAGATVYVTGRTTPGCKETRGGEADLPGNIEECAAEVTAAGGRGIPVQCDLANDQDIQSLFERVTRDSARVDVLVNNAAFLHEDMTKQVPFWQRSLAMADILTVGLRCHYLAIHTAAPLMLKQGRGLIVNVSFYGRAGMHDPAYYAAKAGLDKLAAAVANDLRPFGVAALSLWPGIVATERVTALAEQMVWLREQLPTFETPGFVGRVISELFRWPQLMKLSGKTLIVAEVAKRLGITDVAGRQPPSYRERFGGPHAEFDGLALLQAS